MLKRHIKTLQVLRPLLSFLELLAGNSISTELKNITISLEFIFMISFIYGMGYRSYVFISNIKFSFKINLSKIQLQLQDKNQNVTDDARVLGHDTLAF